MRLLRQAVAIVNTLTLQGGITRDEQTEAETFVGALDGETLSKVPQRVPGGLSGLVSCDELAGLSARKACETVFRNGATAVSAIIELAKPPGEIGIDTDNLSNQEGIALSLPVKIHLTNALLGGNCYVGSSSAPVTFNLTTGTTSPPWPNGPIRGKLGRLAFKDEFEFVDDSNNILVDNAFSAPRATGCGGTYASLLDPIIDSRIGLPGAAGKNTAILGSTLAEGTTVGVIASEK